MPSPTLVCRLFRDGVQFCSDLVDLVVGECDHGGVSWMRHIRRLVVAVRGPRWLPGEARSGLKAGRLSPVKPSSAPAVEMRHPSMAYTRPRRAAGTLDLRHHAFALGDFGVVFRDGVSRPSYVVSFRDGVHLVDFSHATDVLGFLLGAHRRQKSARGLAERIFGPLGMTDTGSSCRRTCGVGRRR